MHISCTAQAPLWEAELLGFIRTFLGSQGSSTVFALICCFTGGLGKFASDESIKNW